MARCIAIQDHDIPVTQHGLASYVTKFESQSFRLRSKIWGSLCSARKLLAQSAVSVSVCVEVKVKGQGEGQILAFFLELASKLLYCAYASCFTENKGLLTEQALLLSKESWLRQQASGPSCANALVLCLLLH